MGAIPSASWRFLPPACQRVDSGDRDPDLLAMLCAHAIRLGFRTLAVDALDALPSDFAADPQVVALRDAAESLRTDVLSPHHRADIVRGNLDSLGPAGQSLRAAFDDWARRSTEAQAFIANDGNVAIRGDASRPFAFRVLRNARAEATAAWRPGVNPLNDPTGHPPILLAGFTSPWLLQRVIEGTPKGPTGYSPRIWLFEPDPRTALDGLSVLDLRQSLAAERLGAFLGPDAPERLRNSFASHDEAHLPREIVETPGASCVETAQVLLRRAASAQIDAHEQLRNIIAARSSARSARYWSVRCELSERGSPTRVLIATTRYSTVTCASAFDLADAFRAQDCSAEVLIEPDSHTRMSTVAYLRRIAEFDPDLIVVINYPRQSLPAAIPDGIPCITWVQDSMPHLFDPSLGGKRTEYDLAIGVLSTRMTQAMGVPVGSHSRFPVVANIRKFHKGPATQPLESSHECEVAHVGHQSETAESLRDAFVRSLRSSAQPSDFVAPLFDAVRAMTLNPRTRWGHELRAVAHQVLQESTGRAPSPADVERLVAMFARPIADRMLRHQSLEWAARICARRGWRLHIFGAGWDKHPTLKAYARGPVDHGEPLRSVYQTAAVNLHASVTTLCHQRVFECALSGGLPLCRHIEDAIAASQDAAVASAVRRKYNGVVPETIPSIHTDADPDLKDFAASLRQMKREPQPEHKVSPRLERLIRGEHVIPYSRSALGLLANPAEVLFTSEEELEFRITRAVEDRAWRDSLSQALAERAAEHASHDSLARKMLTMTRSAMNAVAASQGS